MAQVRYIVNDVSEAVEFYVSKLGFKLEQQFGPAIAILNREDVQKLGKEIAKARGARELTSLDDMVPAK